MMSVLSCAQPRRALRVLVTFVVVATISCASHEAPVEKTIVSGVLERTNQAARTVFEQQNYEQAESLYRETLEIAYTRDNLEAIVDAQYNVAVCLLRLESYDEALGMVHQTRNELSRSQLAVPEYMSLLEATILYRQGNYDAAWALTEHSVTTPPQTSGQSTNRAHFLRGLIAVRRGKTRQLRTEIAAMGEPTDPRLQADYRELSGHLALAEDRWETAIRAFTEAAKLRSDTGDYRGMVRVLAVVGDVFERAGQPSEAANHFLRGGRSAAIQGANSEASELLTRATRLAEQVGDHKTAQDAQEHLSKLRDAEQARSPGISEN